MGSNLNFKNMVEAPTEGSGVGRPPGVFPLTRQPSVYSLTFDEFQNTMGGLGKDFGSMNMDEFLRNIWTAEEAQVMGTVPSAFGAGTGAAGGSGVAVEGGLPNGNLQRQGSLTLPRTLSTKTVDQVWKDLYKENGGVLKDGDVNVNLNDSVAVGSNMQQRQLTLGEITLEEFLVRAGVVREEPQAVGRPSNTTNSNGFYGEMFGTNNNNNNGGLTLGFGQQPNRPNGIAVDRVNDNNNLLVNQSPNLDMNMNGNMSSQQQQQQQQQLQRQQQQPHHQHILPKQPAVSYASPLHLTNNGHSSSPVIRGVGGLGDTMMTNGFVLGGGLNMVGLGGAGGGAGTAVTIVSTSPANRPSDGIGKSNGDNSSLSPVPYVFNGTLRGKRSGAVEKVVERRQRRMIKNRESAARSRARKQTYTMELEAEVAKLKEENQELQKKQAEIVEMQKNQESEKMSQQPRSKRPCLRRTQTGPW